MNSPGTQSERLLTVAETAERLGVSEITVRRRVYEGELGAVKLGRSPGAPVRISEDDLEAWLSTSRVARPSAAGPGDDRQSSSRQLAGPEGEA
jgi:excisionase family DNA binding protein